MENRVKNRKNRRNDDRSRILICASFTLEDLDATCYEPRLTYSLISSPKEVFLFARSFARHVP